MKTFNKTFLPDTVTYNGETYKPNGSISAEANAGKLINIIYAALKGQKRKAILVNVLSRNLKGKTDLHGRPYQPTKWIYTNDQ